MRAITTPRWAPSCRRIRWFPTREWVIDYNRFLHARGNPLKFTDPSGQEAYCFLGGWNPDTEDKAISLHDHCTGMLTAIEYTKEEHGEIKIVGNSPWIVEEVYEEILALKTGKNPSSRPIVLACFSWGCPSALEVARLLSGIRHDDAGLPNQEHAPVRVDLLVMIEAEDFGHFFPLIRVPKNVADSYYYYSCNAEEYDIKINVNPFFGVEGAKEMFLGFPATEGTWANGPDQIEGVDKTKTFAIPANHCTIWDFLPWGKTPAKDALTGKDVPLPAFPY